MEILKDFGVNPVLLVAQIVNFLVILFVLKRFMYKPVLDMLKKRENQIRDGLKSGELGEKKLTEAEEKEKQILQKARSEADKMIADVKIEADELKEEKLEQTRREVEKMLEQARLTITQETTDAEERLTQKIGQIAISLLEKSLTGIFGEKEQKLILKKAQAQLMKHE
ncbi:MAG: hypothetical protein ACD_37C00072G0003 [uncultured bacterium]|nr:MAG: hypothetical protein ACD_37C00072G0003 [uncultured bacterium]